MFTEKTKEEAELAEVVYHPCLKGLALELKEAKQELKEACQDCDFKLTNSCVEDPSSFYTSEDYLYEV